MATEPDAACLAFPYVAGIIEREHEGRLQILMTVVFTPRGDDAASGFRPFCCTQQLLGGHPWVGFVFRCRVEPGVPVDQADETKDVRWADAVEVKRLFEEAPERFFTLEVPALDYFFREVVAG